MLTIQNYRKVQSLSEAYELNQKRSSRVLGGMMWMRLSDANAGTVIDLSGLGLDQIEETEEAFSIGCMVTLRQMETHAGLQKAFGGAVKESVKHIIGVQFRNGATIGGSVFGRFGFSDILTLLLSLDTYVELYKGGVLPLREFVGKERDNDILVRVILKKDGRRVCYLSQRNAETDFPVLACAVALLCGKEDTSRQEDVAVISIGARPMRAALIERTIPKERDEQTCRAFAKEAAGAFTYGTNMRGSREYRQHLAEVDIYRCLRALDV